MASIGPKKVGSDQILDPEFLVSFTVSSFSIDRYFFQEIFKCNAYGNKNVLRLGKFCGQLGPKGPNWHSLPCNSDWYQVQQQCKVVKHFNKNRYK